MRSEWTSVGDSVLFWSQDYDDDTATKLALVQQMAEMSTKLCTKCKPPKEWPYLSVFKKCLIKAINFSVILPFLFHLLFFCEHLLSLNFTN